MAANPSSTRPQAAHLRGGILLAVLANLVWGSAPIYFHALGHVDPLVIVSCRILFSVPFCLALTAATRQTGEVRAALRAPKRAAALCTSAVLVGVNWSLYIYAVSQHHVLASSLGYYINPLVSVLLGTLFLRERLSPRQWLAIGLAALAVTLLAEEALGMLWISISLALTFSLYGLVRKVVVVPAVAGLTVETLVLAPPAAAYLAWLVLHRPEALLGFDAVTYLLLAGMGLITTVPLVLFAEATRQLDLSIVGVLMYITPSLQFLVGILALGEALRPIQLACFVLIWLAIGIYLADLALRNRRPVTA
ncbi:EamA family transporter RarD [Novosphingobium flavum]|uniref:EamA family transporter RarD n=1 Tax=Novosphingobium flavum TaxID=1778672 RepID=A0A7X1KLQ0_9SPHN|nr:EamA family transporter RarD [Novosphingobium flavum]MBC2665817.1 EamA family transporter RarD [Novosphingobium flavum]